MGGRTPLRVVLVKRSFSLAGHRTSVALEPAFWRALERAGQSSGTTLLAIVARIDAERAPAESLASALRVWALENGAGPSRPDAFRSPC